MIKEIQALLWKEIMLELRSKYAINGVLLYTFSTIFICYLSFDVLNAGINPFTWNALFWIIMLFSGVSAVSKSFVQESDSRHLYYFHLVSPEGVILSKILYNTLLLSVLSVIGYFVFSLVLGNPVQDQRLFLIVIIMANIGFSTTLTLMSGIAGKARNNGILMPILSFPLVIPIMLMVVKISRNAIDGIAASESWDEIITLLAVDVIAVSLAYMLFPYLWRN